MKRQLRRLGRTVIGLLIVCLGCVELARGDDSAERVVEVDGESVAAVPGAPQFEPLPIVQPSDTFTATPIKRNSSLTTITLDATPPQGSPTIAHPWNGSRSDAAQVPAEHRDPTLVSWVAPAQSHKPVYFEEVGVERYGQTRSPALQPVISGGKFLANAAILPYRMGVDSPHRASYDVGLPRPGSPTGGVREVLPFSLRGALYQGAATTGAVFFIRP